MPSLKMPAAILACCLCLISCSSGRPGHLDRKMTGPAPCPASPNCVSSDSSVENSRIAAFELTVPAATAWPLVGEQVADLPRTRIVTTGEDYLHAECRSFLFGFVDDLELYLRPDAGEIAVRSAARLGYYDFGVNRRRVEDLRTKLREKGVVR